MIKKAIPVIIAAALITFAGCGNEESTTEIITETSVSESLDFSETDETEIVTEETTTATDDTDNTETEATYTEAEITSEAVTENTSVTAATTIKSETTAETITEAEEDEAEEAVSIADDEELVDDAESSSSALSGKWTVTKISDSNGNESSLKDFCELIEIKQDEIKAVYNISDEGIISVTVGGKTKEYSYFEADGNIIMSDDSSMTILMYDSSKKTITLFDDTYGVNLILTK